MYFYPPFLKAQTDVRPEIASVKSLLHKYRVKQKINLHVSLAILYAENSDWPRFYEHLSQIYTQCPRLKTYKIMYAVSERADITDDSEIIAPEIVQKLSKLGLKDLNTSQKALDYLTILESFCSRVCKDPAGDLPEKSENR